MNIGSAPVVNNNNQAEEEEKLPLQEVRPQPNIIYNANDVNQEMVQAPHDAHSELGRGMGGLSLNLKPSGVKTRSEKKSNIFVKLGSQRMM